MGTMRPRPFTLADLRKLPETRPSLEFFGGRVIQKIASGLVHSLIQCELMVAIHSHATAQRQGEVDPGLRCDFGGSSHVFDLCAFVQDRLPDPTDPADCERIVVPPDFAIEIRSPEQTVGELSRKLRSAIRRGVRLGWLIDEGRRHFHVLGPGREPRVLGPGDVLDGGEIFPGFSLPVAKLFGWVDGP